MTLRLNKEIITVSIQIKGKLNFILQYTMDPLKFTLEIV